MRLDDADDVATALGDLPPVSTAFAYGSAVFGQRGYTEADRRAAMTDLVLVVDDPVEWHRANLQLHASHYSFLGGLGVDAVSMAQAIGAGVYYNTGVRLGGRLDDDVIRRILGRHRGGASLYAELHHGTRGRWGRWDTQWVEALVCLH